MAKRIECSGKPITFWFNGQPIDAYEGDSIAAALVAADISTLRTTPVNGNPRGIFCMMGTCFDCLVEVEGEPNRQACMTPVREGLQVCSQMGGVEVNVE